MQKRLIVATSCLALLFPCIPALAMVHPVSIPNNTPSTEEGNVQVKVTIKDTLNANWFIIDKHDEKTPKQQYQIQPIRLPDGSIKKRYKGWQVWIERVSAQTVTLRLKISNFIESKKFVINKTPTKLPQCQTYSLKNNDTTVCIAMQTSTTKQKQGLW